MTANAATDRTASRIVRLATCAIAVLALLLVLAVPDSADAAPLGHQASHDRKAKRSRGQRSSRANRRHRHRRLANARRHRHARARARRLRLRRTQAERRLAVASNTVVAESKHKKKNTVGTGDTSGALDAGFEEGLLNWNTAGVGEALPTVVDDTVRSGAHAGRFAVSGNQDRSELILGGNGGGSTDGMVEFGEGAEYWYGFSFEIDQMIYGHPGAHNLIMQFKGDDDGSPAFGLQLWDYEGDDGEYEGESRGLWSHGPAMDGDRFLAPVSEHAWHDVAIHFKASAVGDGFYEVFLDGRLVDSRNGVSMIASGAGFAYIKDGLYRNGGSIPGTSEIHLDAARLGQNLAAVEPS